jgi:hypothetical protein
MVNQQVSVVVAFCFWLFVQDFFPQIHSFHSHEMCIISLFSKELLFFSLYFARNNNKR